MMEGHEMFGPLQLRRIDWQQEMFEEEERLEQGEVRPESGKASSSGQAMEVDDESKRAVTEQTVTVDATKVEEEKKEEETSLWAGVGMGRNFVNYAKLKSGRGGESSRCGDQVSGVE